MPLVREVTTPFLLSWVLFQSKVTPVVLIPKDLKS